MRDETKCVRRALGWWGWLSLSLCVAVHGDSAQTVPIAVDVEMAESLSQPWTEDQLAGLREALLYEFDEILGEQMLLSHWDFFRRDPNTFPRVLLRIAVVEGGPNEYLYELQLGLLRKSSMDSNEVSYGIPTLLDHRPLLDPVDMLAGSPGPAEIRDLCRLLLREALVNNQAQAMEIVATLSQWVPLGMNPIWSSEREKMFVLPLAKGRYRDLRWSIFRVRSGSGPPQEREVEVAAEDLWGPYNDDLQEALMARILDPPDHCRPDSFSPIVVFLEEYVPEGYWDTD